MGEESAPPEKKCTPRENPGYANEKRAPALRWYGAPEWLIRPLSICFGFSYILLRFKTNSGAVEGERRRTLFSQIYFWRMPFPHMISGQGEHDTVAFHQIVLQKYKVYDKLIIWKNHRNCSRQDVTF